MHTNGDLYLAGGNLSFVSRVSAHGEIVTDRMRNGWDRADGWGLGVSVIDGLPSNHQTALATAASNAGAGTHAGSVVDGPDIPHSDGDRYDGTASTYWAAISAQFRQPSYPDIAWWAE